RIAGGDGRAVFPDVLEISAAGKFPPQDQRGPARERRQCAQNLGGTPVVGTKIVDAVGAGHAKSIPSRNGVAKQLAKAQHRTLRSVARARGEENYRVVPFVRRWQACFTRLAAADGGIKVVA